SGLRKVTAKVNAARGTATHSVQAGMETIGTGGGTMPNSAQICVAATVPKPSFSSTAMAPAMRAVPETRSWLESSRTAAVRLMPGNRMIRLATTTERTWIGTRYTATRVAMIVASRAEMASNAAAI